MKKTLTIVLALVLALSMLASFAFVLNPGTGGSITADKSPLVITGFFATNNDEIKSGARLYAPLADRTNEAYAKNEIIRFAITMDVLNPLLPVNAVDSAWKTADPVELTVSSSTVDFAVSNMAGQQALHVPFGGGLVTAINSKQNNNTPTTADVTGAYGAKVDSKNVMTILVKLADTLTVDKSAFTETEALADTQSMILYAPAGTTAKASYAFIFTGITKGEITDQGLAKLVTDSTDENVFPDPLAGLIKVEKNGRIYYVEKIIDTTDPETNLLVKHPYITKVADLSAYYASAKVGYRVYLVGEKDTTGEYKLIPVAQFDTESITWTTDPLIIADKDLRGEEVEGLGYSLGLEKLVPNDFTVALDSGKFPPTYATAPTIPASQGQARVFRTVLSDGTVRYILGDDLHDTDVTKKVGATAFDATELARLNTMMADFGFSTDVNYTYKLEDKYFTTAGTDIDVLTATYNNGTVTPIPTEDDEDLEEGTPEDELEDGEEIEEDIEEGEDVIEDDVPAETGDFASDIAIALTAAAIVAAAALAFVMKKARD